MKGLSLPKRNVIMPVTNKDQEKSGNLLSKCEKYVSHLTMDKLSSGGLTLT